MNLSVYFKTAVVLFLVDLFWLGTGGIIARAMTERIQGETMTFRYLSAAIVYLLLSYMLLETSSYQQAFIYGVCIYGVYDFTSHAIYSRYDWKFGLADTLWGGILFICARYLLKNVL
jgi:uncharacterized membrane protein